MAKYVWKGINRYGELVTGERAAHSIEDLASSLQREQIAGIAISRKKSEIDIPFLHRRKVKVKELAIYSRQLSVLIDAELPLIQSLNILADQTKNKYFKSVIKRVREDVEAGSTLNQAKRKFPDVFDSLYCNLVASGEQSGTLDVMLTRLAEYLEKVVKLRSQVKQATLYPLAILSFAVLVIIFMMWKVVPVFSSIFLELGAELPFLTTVILSVSHFIQKHILHIFLALVVSVVLLRFLRGEEKGRRLLDQILLNVPLFGKILEKISLSRLTRTLSTLLSGGVPMLESLKITSSTAGNVVIENFIMRARKMVAEGASLRDSFNRIGYFPLMFIQMVNVGEATGTLDDMLAKLADFYDSEVESTVAALLSVLEPFLLIVVGGLVGTIVVSMYLPIFSLMQQL